MLRKLVVSCAAVALAAPLLVVACKEGETSGTTSSATGTGGAGGCSDAPAPRFTLTLTAKDGPVPLDTTVVVTWSAGEEPPLVLSDPSTYKTLDEANFVCDLDPNEPPPTDLEALVCRLWTTGPTEVRVTAGGYMMLEETLIPETSEKCDGPVPTAVAMELIPEIDAGVH